MLTIQIPGEEYWDADREEFICRKATTLALEHSLLSLSKWESKWHVPFLDAKNGLTPEQMQALKAFLLQNHIRYGRVE